MTLRPCLECGTPSRGARCPEHDRSRGYRPLDPHWRSVRAARLHIDADRCQLRHTGCTGTATSVHLDPALERDHSRATVFNTISACAHCHGVEDGRRSRGRSKNLSSITPAESPAHRKIPCTGFGVA